MERCKAYVWILAYHPWTSSSASNFSKCFYPAACLGGPNLALKNKFELNGRDIAAENLDEACNLEMGYETKCDRDLNHRCRLCATCAEGYRHKDVSGTLR